MTDMNTQPVILSKDRTSAPTIAPRPKPAPQSFDENEDTAAVMKQPPSLSVHLPKVGKPLISVQRIISPSTPKAIAPLMKVSLTSTSTTPATRPSATVSHVKRPAPQITTPGMEYQTNHITYPREQENLLRRNPWNDALALCESQCPSCRCKTVHVA